MGPRVGAWVCQWRRDVRYLGPTMTHRTREIAKSLANSTNSPECILYLLLWQSRRVGWYLWWVGGCAEGGGDVSSPQWSQHQPHLSIVNTQRQAYKTRGRTGERSLRRIIYWWD